MQAWTRLKKTGVVLITGIFLLMQYPAYALGQEVYPVTWDLQELVASEEEWDASLEQGLELIALIEDMRGQLNSADAIVTLREYQQAFAMCIEPLRLYADLCSALDPSDAANLYREAQVSLIYQQYQTACAYIDPEIFELPLEKRQQIFKDERLLPYAYYYESYTTEGYGAMGEALVQILQPYWLSGTQFLDVYEVLSYVELPTPVITLPDGEETALTDAAYSNILEQDYPREVKLAANETMQSRYADFRHTYASILQGKISSSWADAQLLGYDSIRSYSMESEGIPEDVYFYLKKAVHESLDALQEYLTLRKQALGLESQYGFDLSTSSSDYHPKYSYDQAVDAVRETLDLLGVEYIQSYNQLVCSGHIDVYPAENKNTGAFSSGSVTTEEPVMPYMLLNFTGSDYDVSTLAHESGHAIYDWLTQKNQPPEYRNITIFTHEVASTTNELLYYIQKIENAETEEERLFYLEEGLQLFYGALFIQTLYSEFEEYACQTVEDGGILSADLLDAKWQELYQAYRGDTVQQTDSSASTWAGIPHFFNSDYYVYKYACDICYASVLAQNIYHEEPGALEAYQEFLKKGSSESPADLLLGAGVDILDPNIYQEGMHLFMQWLDQYRSIIENRDITN